MATRRVWIVGVLAIGMWVQGVLAGTPVRVGVYENSPKVATTTHGQAEGIFIDVLEAVAKKHDWTITYVPGTWAQGLERLKKGEIDLMPDVAYTPERAQSFAFHQEPVLASWNQVYTRAGVPVRSLLDMQGLRVAVLRGSVQQGQFIQMTESFSLSTRLQEYDDFDAAFSAVAQGGADAVVTNRFFGVRNANRYGLQDTAIIFAPSKLYFASPAQGREALLTALDTELRVLKSQSNSVYYQSLRRWAVDEVRAATPSWLWPAAISASLALALSTIAAVWLRRRVKQQTQALRQRQAQTESVNRVLRSIARHRGLQQVLDESLSGLIGLGFDGGVLCLQNESGTGLRVGARSQRAGDSACEGRVCAMGCMVSNDLLEKGQMVAVRSAHEVRELTGCTHLEDPKANWYCYFVLQLPQGSAGVLCLYAHAPAAPEPALVQTVSDLCAAVAMAMDNARLYEQVQQHAQELERRVALRTAELSNLSELLQALIDHIGDPIFYKGPDLRYLGCNAAYERTFGVQSSAFIGRTVLELDYLPQADREAYQAEDAQVLERASTVRREARIPFADGKLHDTLYSVTGFRTSQGGGVVGVITDITPLKDVQAALEQARFAAESADRTKSAFLATMSHELRTPLNSIIGFTGIVLQGLAGPLNDEQSKQLGMVRDSARHLLALINDVLDISKIEAGELRVDRAPFAIAPSLQRVIGMAHTLAERKGLSLALDVVPGLDTMVGDARRFEQVLLNLVGNAIKFSEKGQVRVRAQPVREAGVDCVRIQVHDQGMGIRAEDLATLFTPFRQIDSALSRQHEGSGLGLAICRRLCTLMGGHIGVESVWEQGSVFTVTLPLQAPEPSASLEGTAQGALA